MSRARKCVVNIKMADGRERAIKDNEEVSGLLLFNMHATFSNLNKKHNTCDCPLA